LGESQQNTREQNKQTSDNQQTKSSKDFVTAIIAEAKFGTKEKLPFKGNRQYSLDHKNSIKSKVLKQIEYKIFNL